MNSTLSTGGVLEEESWLTDGTFVGFLAEKTVGWTFLTGTGIVSVELRITSVTFINLSIIDGEDLSGLTVGHVNSSITDLGTRSSVL